MKELTYFILKLRNTITHNINKDQTDNCKKEELKKEIQER